MSAEWFETLRRGSCAQVLARLADDPALARAVEPEGMPAIFLAVMRDDPAIVAALLRHGASAEHGFVGPAIGLPWTELPTLAGAVVPTDHPIAFAKSHAVLSMLVEAGAEVGRASLRMACRGGREAIDFLLARGVVPDAEDLREAPIELLPRLLEFAEPDSIDRAMRCWCEEDRREAIGVALARGASLASGHALAAAAAFDHVELVRLLLDAGADPDATLDDGSTPLIEAAFEGAEASALLLLAAGAEPARVNRQGQSALDGARESGAERLVARLMERDGC